LDDITDKYGPAFDGNGAISSKLTYAARLAMINGASEIIGVATTGSASTDYEAALLKLMDEKDARVIVATNGTATVNSAVASHVTSANAQGLYRIGVVGRDGSTTSVAAATLRSAAQGFNNEAVRLVSPSRFVTTNPVSGLEQTVGGE
jgi:hypothetical protein